MPALTSYAGKRLALLKEQGKQNIGFPNRDPLPASGSGPSLNSPESADCFEAPPLTLVKAPSHTSRATPMGVDQLALSAMLENGRLLGISMRPALAHHVNGPRRLNLIECGHCWPSKSQPPTPELPYSLHPTLLQLSTVHWQWIDRFPFPTFRDNLILHMGDIEEEDLITDLFTIPTFKIARGAKSWDPNGWRVCYEFAEKWPFLFADPTASVVELD
jgi:Domain of unknown function (DUF3425)